MSILDSRGLEPGFAPGADVFDADAFYPPRPTCLDETGLDEAMVDSLVGKHLLKVHAASGRRIANVLGLAFSIVEARLAAMKTKRLVVSTNVSFGDFEFQLSEEGHRQSLRWMEACNYVGPAPVRLDDYVAAIRAQSVRQLTVTRETIERAFRSISIRPLLLHRIGAAIRSGSGLFLHGGPGNGKTTIAELIGRCYDEALWIPRMLVVDGRLVKLFDPAYHEEMRVAESSGPWRADEFDERWARIRRPTVVTGGELTLDSLEIRHDHATNISESPFQLKANGGVLLIDDLGRQRVAPAELFNRWIVPLDRRYDLLTLHTGKKFQVPFELMIVFSTNIEPKQLCDEAFLRRVPCKVRIPDPDVDEFKAIFRSVAGAAGVEYSDAVVTLFVDAHYRPHARPLRRCHPRDLLHQLTSYCDYRGLPRELRLDYLNEIAPDYFLMNE